MNAQAMLATFLSLTSFPPLLPPLLTLNISYFFINLGNIKNSLQSRNQTPFTR